MAWNPSDEEKRYIELVATMSIDCLRGNGTVDAMTYISNLRAIAKSIENIKNSAELQNVLQPDTISVRRDCSGKRLF